MFPLVQCPSEFSNWRITGRLGIFGTESVLVSWDSLSLWLHDLQLVRLNKASLGADNIYSCWACLSLVDVKPPTVWNELQIWYSLNVAHRSAIQIDVAFYLSCGVQFIGDLHLQYKVCWLAGRCLISVLRHWQDFLLMLCYHWVSSLQRCGELSSGKVSKMSWTLLWRESRRTLLFLIQWIQIWTNILTEIGIHTGRVTVSCGLEVVIRIQVGLSSILCWKSRVFTIYITS